MLYSTYVGQLSNSELHFKYGSALLITTMIIKILMNVNYHFGIDFAGFFEVVWKKIR